MFTTAPRPLARSSSRASCTTRMGLTTFTSSARSQSAREVSEPSSM